MPSKKIWDAWQNGIPIYHQYFQQIPSGNNVEKDIVARWET